MKWFKPYSYYILAIIFPFIVQLYAYKLKCHIIFCLYSLLPNQHRMNLFFFRYSTFRHSTKSIQASDDYNLMHKLSPVQSHTHIRKEEEERKKKILWIPPWILITSRRNRNTRPFRLNYFYLIALVFHIQLALNSGFVVCFCLRKLSILYIHDMLEKCTRNIIHDFLSLNSLHSFPSLHWTKKKSHCHQFLFTLKVCMSFFFSFSCLFYLYTWCLQFGYKSHIYG